MKKGKIIRILIGILLVFLVVWAGMFITDYIRCGSLREPVFVMAGDTADDGGSGEYFGLGYRVEVRKHIDAEFGPVTDSVTMYVGGRIISASIQ